MGKEYTTLAIEKELSRRIGLLAAKLGVSKVEVVRLGVALVEESVKKGVLEYSFMRRWKYEGE